MVFDVPSTAGGRVVVDRIRRSAVMTSRTLPSDKNTSTAIRLCVQQCAMKVVCMEIRVALRLWMTQEMAWESVPTTLRLKLRVDGRLMN